LEAPLNSKSELRIYVASRCHSCFTCPDHFRLPTRVSKSVQISAYLLKFRANSTSARYKASTKTQIKHKNSTSTQKQNAKQTNQKTKHVRKKTT